MTWFRWKWGRLATTETADGSVVFDADGRWFRIAGRLWLRWGKPKP